MLRPPLPITRTFFTSTRSRALGTAPLFRYACALGASCVLFHVAETFVKARSCRSAAGDSLLARREVSGLVARAVKPREDPERAIDRSRPVRAGARRAKQRAIVRPSNCRELSSS